MVPGGDRVDPDRRKFDGERAGDGVGGRVGGADGQHSDGRFASRGAGEEHERTIRGHARREVLGEQDRADDLGLERQRDGLGGEVADLSAGSDRGGGDDVIDGTEAFGERTDAGLRPTTRTVRSVNDADMGYPFEG